MDSLPSSRFYSRRSVGALLIAGLLVGVTVGGSVTAAPSTKATWKVSSLTAGQVKKLSTLVETNSPGVKSWSKKGSCTLTPTRKPTKVTMGATGSCKLTLKIAKSKNYPAKTLRKTITLIASATTVAPATTVASATTVALSCAQGGLCVVGNEGPGGGTVYYVASSNFTSAGTACGVACKYLEVAAVGWMTSSTPPGQTVCDLTPVTNSTDPDCEWSGNTSDAIGSTGTGIGTGYANTSAMITQSNNAGKAATVARAFHGGSKTDWFLPSKDELNALCKWAFNDTVNAICNNNGSGGLSLTKGDFAALGYYYSSSEYGATKASVQYFGTGSQYADFKFFGFSVRPVRAF